MKTYILTEEDARDIGRFLADAILEKSARDLAVSGGAVNSGCTAERGADVAEFTACILDAALGELGATGGL